MNYLDSRCENERNHLDSHFSCSKPLLEDFKLIDGGGGECNFSLTILKENYLLLQLPINFSHTVDARIEKHACMVPISIMIVATYLSQTAHFDEIQISVIQPKM